MGLVFGAFNGNVSAVIADGNHVEVKTRSSIVLPLALYAN